jgi:Acetyltransferase (GNAT) family
MAEQPMFTIERIPLQLDLVSLGAEDCLAHAGRHFFSARGRHPMQHPLMHQLGRNPDCRALAICADGVPLALSFFHYRSDEPGRRSAVLHNLMVAPYLRGRGLGSLLALHVLGYMLTPSLRELALEIEFPLPPGGAPFLSALVRDLGAGQRWVQRDEALAALAGRMESERVALVPAVLRNLITEPGYRKRLERRGCALAAVSGDNAVFDAVGAAPWPPHVAVQFIHQRFHSAVAQKLAPFDMALLDAAALQGGALLGEIARSNPHLPLVLVGAEPPGGSPPGVLAAAEPARLPDVLAPYLAAWRPREGAVQGERLRSNLLGLPQRASLVYYRNRHRGQRLFIVASGPSLLEVDTERLRGEVTLTINDALLRFPRARYAAIMDSRKLHELHHELLALEGLFTLKGNSYGTEVTLLGTDGFSLELEQGAYSGYTTAFFALQIAVFMGFREICYLGLDLGNTARQSHFFGNRTLQDRDRPDVYARMRQSFERVAPRLRELGVSVYNCSPVSTLKCFPYRSLDDVLSARSA